MGFGTRGALRLAQRFRRCPRGSEHGKRGERRGGRAAQPWRVGGGAAGTATTGTGTNIFVFQLPVKEALLKLQMFFTKDLIIFYILLLPVNTTPVQAR